MSRTRSDLDNTFQKEYLAVVTNIMKTAKKNLQDYADKNTRFSHFNPNDMQSPWTSLFKSKEETELASLYEYRKYQITSDLLHQFDALERATLAVTNIHIQHDITHLLSQIANLGFGAIEELNDARINFKQDDSSKLFKHFKLITEMANKSISDYSSEPLSIKLQAELNTKDLSIKTDFQATKQLYVYRVKMETKHYRILTEKARRIYPAGKMDATKQVGGLAAASTFGSALAAGGVMLAPSTFGVSLFLSAVGTTLGLGFFSVACADAIGDKSIRLNITAEFVNMQVLDDDMRVKTQDNERGFYILSHKTFKELQKTGTDFIFDETNPDGCQILFSSVTMAQKTAEHLSKLPGVYHELYGFNINGGWKVADTLKLDRIQARIFALHSNKLPADISANQIPEASAPTLEDINQHDEMELEELQRDIDYITITNQSDYANVYPLVNAPIASAPLESEMQTSSSTNYISSMLPIPEAIQTVAPVHASASAVSGEAEITPAESEKLDDQLITNLSTRLSQFNDPNPGEVLYQSIRRRQQKALKSDKQSASAAMSFSK